MMLAQAQIDRRIVTADRNKKPAQDLVFNEAEMKELDSRVERSDVPDAEVQAAFHAAQIPSEEACCVSVMLGSQSD